MHAFQKSSLLGQFRDPSAYNVVVAFINSEQSNLLVTNHTIIQVSAHFQSNLILKTDGTFNDERQIRLGVLTSTFDVMLQNTLLVLLTKSPRESHTQQKGAVPMEPKYSISAHVLLLHVSVVSCYAAAQPEDRSNSGHLTTLHLSVLNFR